MSAEKIAGQVHFIDLRAMPCSGREVASVIRALEAIDKMDCDACKLRAFAAIGAAVGVQQLRVAQKATAEPDSGTGSPVTDKVH